MRAVIRERGNGWPPEGAHVADEFGRLWWVESTESDIHTGFPGEGNWVTAEVQPADWEDLEEGETAWPAELEALREDV